MRFAADQLAGASVTVASLTVQRLDASQQAGGQPQPGQHTEKLHRVPSPMAEQRTQGLPEDHHVKRPLDSTTRCANRAATRGL